MSQYKVTVIVPEVRLAPKLLTLKDAVTGASRLVRAGLTESEVESIEVLVEPVEASEELTNNTDDKISATKSTAKKLKNFPVILPLEFIYLDYIRPTSNYK